MWGLAKKLRETGLVGINQRNAEFLIFNQRKLMPQVDDKYITHQLAIKSEISMPEIYAVVEFSHQLKDIEQTLAPYPDFVIKPSRGSGGEGIIVISGRIKNNYRKISGLILSPEELKHHLLNIMGGMYSLGGHPDKAIIQYRINFDPIFENVCYLGVPDIRIITYMGFPVMSMIRLPTRQSDGKANLHQGAIGAGIKMSSGETMRAVWRNEIIEEHPDTGHAVMNLKIPHWEMLLGLAAKCYEITGLGYQGVDIALDKEKGPMILELNARPGLQIQLANRAGLEGRLRAVEIFLKSQNGVIPNFQERVKFAQNNF